MAATTANATAEIEYKIEQAFLEAERTCTSPWVLDYSRDLPGTKINFHQLMLILSAAACIIANLIAMYLTVGHLLHWTMPREQKQIVRVILFIPAYSLCAFWALWFYHADGFVVPFGQWYEGLALTAVFLLYVEIASPDPTTRESFFHQLERRWYTGKKKSEAGSLRWFRGLYVMVFQLFFTRIATVIAAEVIWGVTCPLSSVRKNATTVITTIQSTSTGFAIWGCILIESRLHPIMHPHLAQLKLITFKAVVFFESIQSVIFPILAYHRIYKVTFPYYIGFNDFAVGIPQFMLVMEMVFVAVSYLWSFHFNRYRGQVLREGKLIQANSGAALLQIFDMTDVWQSVAYAFFGMRSSLYPTQTRTYQPVDSNDPLYDKTDESGHRMASS